VSFTFKKEMIQFQSRKINCSASKDLSVTDGNAKVKNSEKNW